MAGLVQYNFTIDDTSPVLTYSPYADFDSANGRGDGLQNGWQTWYSGSGYLSSADGPTPNGESFHLTSLPGASVSLSFYGTGVVLYGLTNCSYDVEFDGNLMPNTTLKQGVFFSLLDVDPGDHNVSLIARPNGDDQVLSFNGALVSSAANASTPTPATMIIDNQNTNAISYTGNWTPSETVPGIPSAGAAAPFHSTTASGASASLNFTGRGIALYGSSTTNHGQYSVTLDDVRQVFNGSSQWLLGNMLLFYQDGLDENSTHSLDLTNLNGGSALSLSSVRITQFDSAPGDSASSASASGSPRVGAIVGPVIAFIVLAGVLGLYIWTRRRDKCNPYLKRRDRRSSISSSIFLPQSFRRKQQKREEPITPYVLDFRRSPDAGTRGSVVSSKTSFTFWDRAERINTEKSTSYPDTQIPEGFQREAPSSNSVTYSSGDVEAIRSGSVRLSTQPLPAYPPPSHPRIISNSGRGSSARSDDPTLIERVAELVSLRIDSRSSLTNMPRGDSNDRLPPYPGSV